MTNTIAAVGGRTISAAPAAAAPRVRRSWAWIGVVPFFAFLSLFLIVPALSVFEQALHNNTFTATLGEHTVTSGGGFGFDAMKEAFQGQNLDAFWFSIRFSAGASLAGVLIGTLLAYAAVTAKRPKWLRSLVTSFSGVAANLGGLPLAFAFITLMGRQGLLTKILTYFGFNLYGGDFNLGQVSGLITVYSYFNIPLMVLITLPAIDGLKASWREASANLGGSSFTYWRRVGIPVLTPSLLGGFLLLFANSFSAFATAKVLTDNSKIVSLRLGFFLGGDINVGQDAIGYALAAWMIIIMAFCMGFYWVLRKRAERWQT
ncbi:MAG: binding-protein-dependent transport system inner rane component [Acidimicrobiales bacterium]|nr:binding-protein-dependent transport system inner rane component [Acidimicrobiales bacterium]